MIVEEEEDVVSWSVMRLYCVDVIFVFFFFFQAEDGIRDSPVTGVQTCALPIYQFFLYDNQGQTFSVNLY